jgi:type IV pilus assembly protein PilM
VAKQGVIGLDIGTTHVRAAEVLPGRDGPRSGQLVAYGEVPLPAGAVRDGEVEEVATVASAIKQLWSQTKFSSRDVNIGVGNQRVVVRELDLPWMPLQQLRTSLSFHVQDLLPMPVDEALLDYFPTAEFDGPQGRLVRGMLVAATRDTVRANVMAVETAGLHPKLVDLTHFALMRALISSEHLGSTVAIVEMGARLTQVVVAAHGMPQFIRMLPSGGQNVTDAVAGAMGVSPVDAEGIKRQVGIGYRQPPELAAAAEAVDSAVRPLVEAVRNTFVYYASNHPGAGIDLVLLTGGGAQLPGLGQYLASASRLPITLGDAFGGVRIGKGVAPMLEGKQSLVALPLGLAYGVAA